MLRAVVTNKICAPRFGRFSCPSRCSDPGLVSAARSAQRVVGMSCSTYLYDLKRKGEGTLKLRIKEITDTPVHCGYGRVHVLLRREGHRNIVRRIHRIRREQSRSLRLKRLRRNWAAKWRQPKQLCTPINELWSMDFVASTQPTDASCAC